MGSLLNNRKHLSLILVINVVYMVCDSSAATFEKTNKSPLADQLKEEQQQRPSPQDMFGSMGRSFEEELEQRLLLSNLLENNNNHLGNCRTPIGRPIISFSYQGALSLIRDYNSVHNNNGGPDNTLSGRNMLMIISPAYK